MARKIQLGALIVGMLLVGVERFTAHASTPPASAPATQNGVVNEVMPFPPPN
jgi:hypothetical protein